MNAPWFSFSFPDFCFAFVSIVLEGIPFILLGTLISGLIDQFLPSRTMTRFLPKNVFLGLCISAGMGMVFPMCECGIVPVIRRLVSKGLPVSNAVAYMLAAPIVSPIVAISTFAAFRGQSAPEMTVMRLGVGFFVAVIAGLAVHNLPLRWVVKDSVLAGVLAKEGGGGSASGPTGGILTRLGMALQVAVKDFFDVTVFFVIGVAVASLFSTSVNKEIILPLASNIWVATASMMGFATLLSLCSTSDAFIAATFVTFPATAKLAFLVFGPMFDFKLLFIYRVVFRKRFIAGLAVGLFILVGLIFVRLSFMNQYL